MSPQNAQNERNVLRGERAFYRLVIFALVGINALLGGGWLWTATNQIVAIVPPEIRRPYELGAGHGTRDYLNDMASYVLQQLFTVSPETAEHQARVILKMTDPSGVGALKLDLDKATERIRRDRISTIWTPTTEQVAEPTKTVRVRGNLKTYIGDVLTSTTVKEYEVGFTINSAGRLYVVKVKEVVQSTAGTAGANRAAGPAG